MNDAESQNKSFRQYLETVMVVFSLSYLSNSVSKAIISAKCYCEPFNNLVIRQTFITKQIPDNLFTSFCQRANPYQIV